MSNQTILAENAIIHLMQCKSLPNLMLEPGSDQSDNSICASVVNINGNAAIDSIFTFTLSVVFCDTVQLLRWNSEMAI